MERKLVKAKDLEIGMKLAHVKGVVTHRPSSGLKTPSGKVDLGIDGYLKTWNKNAEIAILID